MIAHVLSAPRRGEEELIAEARRERGAEAVLMLASDGPARVMNELNRKEPPSREARLGMIAWRPRSSEGAAIARGAAVLAAVSGGPDSTVPAPRACRAPRDAWR